MDLKTLNRISSFKGAQKPTVLQLGRVYPIKEIRQLPTKYGEKAILVVVNQHNQLGEEEDEELHIFVPNRLNQPLLDRKTTLRPLEYGVINKGARNNSTFLEFVECSDVDTTTSTQFF